MSEFVICEGDKCSGCSWCDGQGDVVAQQHAVIVANQNLTLEPQHVQPVFILTDAEQQELMDYLWPQWINPNDWPNLKSLLNRLEQARKA